MDTRLWSDATDPPSFDGSASVTDGGDSAFNRLLHEAAKAPPTARVIAAGARLADGRFEILRRIGEGGMGVVFEAFDAARRENVALKTMSRMEARDVYQFKNEFRALADVAHPNLVRLHELSTDGGLWFITMELVLGERFDDWVRPRLLGAPDFERLRDCLAQLCEAVSAIHVAGKLHRDLKPSNVLVPPDGRVVVLDFGLAVDPETGGVGQTVMEESVSGTPAYMAPEQGGGHGATAASDWYAVGVMLFEALTGQLPFTGSPSEIIVDKQRMDAPSVSSLASDAPNDLADVCTRLLARDPSERPDSTELRTLFPVPQSMGSSRSQSSLGRTGSADGYASVAPEATLELLGRESELQVLRDAFEATLADQAVIVFVSGESGMGKSALCEAFLHELRVAGRATVLAGRCYERENVPFKGFDSLVDDLSRHLRKLPREEAAAVLPRDVHALTRLFPVLGRVQVVADAPKKDVPDPLELRRRAYAAFGKFLTRMRDRAPMCVHIDDVQWLDADAVLFMRALMVHPEPMPGLLLLSHRSEHADTNQALLRVRDAIEGNSRLQLRTLSIGPLSQDASRDLAERLLPVGVNGQREATLAIARESGGSPFFVGELSRFVARHGTDSGSLASLSLPAALGDHLSALSRPARRLLEYSALVGKPLPATLLLQAAEATHVELDLLRASHLLRLSSLEGDRIVECYHDKVREAVAGRLSELERVRCYAGLATELEADAYPDPELLAACFEGAGQRASAAEQCARAAEQAMAGTAFLHAADLYEKALGFGNFEPERLQELRVARGHALAQAGRGKQAADVFLLAAEAVQGDRNRSLRRRAAEELLNAGHVDEGMVLFRELFAEFGLTLPSSVGAATRRRLFSQLRLWMRGLQTTPREVGECSPRGLQALTILASAGIGLVMHAPMIGASVADDYLLRALDLGVPEHVANGLRSAAFYLALAQPSAARRLDHLYEAELRIASGCGRPLLFAPLNRTRGAIQINRGKWAQGREHLRRGLDILQNSGRGLQYERDGAQAYDQIAAFYRGDWLDIVGTTPGLVEQGYARDRIWIGAMLSGHCGSVAWLCNDDVTGYQRILEQARARWSEGHDAQWPDFFLNMGEVSLHLYRGEGERALAAVDPRWAWFRRSLMDRAQVNNGMALHLRGMAALTVFRTTGAGAARATVRYCAKRLSALALPFAAAMRATLDAGLALHTRDLDGAAQHLRAAVTGFDDNDMAMHAAAARRRLGELLGCDEGKALLAQGDAGMRAQRVRNIDAITEMLCAGCRVPS